MNKKIVLAGGCFWGLEDLIRTQPGVVSTEVGYTGGENENPTYENHPCHAEAVEIEYDPSKTTYTKLLDFFFQIHNPTTLNQQGNDEGTSYRSAIFYHDEQQKKAALASRKKAQVIFKNPIITEIKKAKKFYQAEGYHQRYLEKQGLFACH